MRIVFCAKRHARSGITTHMERALRALGHEVLRVKLRKAERVLGRRLGWWLFARRIRAFRPDLVLVFTFDLPADRLQELRGVARTATFFDDCPRELDQRIAAAAAASDVFFITNRGQLPLYREQLGIDAAYVTGGCDPVDHFRVPPDPAFVSDVAFIGQPDSRGGRVDVIKHLAARHDVRVYGPHWRDVGLTPGLDDVYPEQYRVICNSARIVLGCDLRDDVELYFSNRTWLSLGSGAFLMTRYVPKLEQILRDGEECVFWRDPDHAGQVVARWLPDAEGRARVAAQGFAYAHREYSYARMLERMLADPRLQPGAPRA